VHYAKLMSHRKNFLLRVDVRGEWITHSDLVAHLSTPKFQKRIVIPAGVNGVKLDPQFMRADVLRRHLQGLRHASLIPCSRFTIDRFTIQAAKQDNASIIRRYLAICGYVIGGFLRRPFSYFRER